MKSLSFQREKLACEHAAIVRLLCCWASGEGPSATEALLQRTVCGGQVLNRVLERNYCVASEET